MKKILAIALALTMIFSMAVAFASNCTTGPFDWSCSTTANKCGKATVEVIPYVKVNNACGGFDWQISNCAAAVNSEKVYYAVKLNVEANPDKAWFNKADFEVTYKGMAAAVADYPMPDFTKGLDLKASKAKSYYLDQDNDTWVEIKDSTDPIIVGVKVADAKKAKVCATIESESNGFNAVVGDFKVKYDKTAGTLDVFASDGTTLLVEYMIKDEKVTAIDYTSVCGKATYAEIKSFMGLDIGTCVTKDALKANFGWDDEVKNCFQWNNDTPAIVSPACEIAIPKTGDAGLLAWLF